MDIKLQIILIIISLLTFVYVIFKIRKSNFNINDAILWIVWVIALIIFSVFSNVSYKISQLFGFESTSNFILTLFILFLYILLFLNSIKMSKIREQNKELIQKISIYIAEKEQNIYKKEIKKQTRSKKQL